MAFEVQNVHTALFFFFFFNTICSQNSKIAKIGDITCFSLFYSRISSRTSKSTHHGSTGSPGETASIILRTITKYAT